MKQRSIKCLVGAFILVTLGWFHVSHAAIVLVQATSSGCPNSNVANCTATFANPTTAGDFYVVTANIGLTVASATLFATVTSTQSDTFQTANSQDLTANGNSLWTYYAMNVVGGASTKINVHLTSSKKVHITIAEYSGVATSSAFDVATSSQGSTKPSNSGNITTSKTGELLIGGYLNDDNGATTTLVSQNGFTLQASELCPISQCEALQDRITTSSPITVSSSFTWTSGSNWAQNIAAFLPAPAASVLLPKNYMLAFNW